MPLQAAPGPSRRGGLLPRDYFGRAAGDEGCEDVFFVDAEQRRVLEVDLDFVPRLETERRCALVGAEAEQRVDRDDVATTGAPARDSFELSQLFERVDPDVRVGADADADSAVAELSDRCEAVAEVRLRRRADADSGTGFGDQIELVRIRVGGVDDCRPGRSEERRVGKEGR